MDTKALQESMIRLRHDAATRGMTDLAIVYGWSAIRLGDERLEAAIRELDPETIRRLGLDNGATRAAR